MFNFLIKKTFFNFWDNLGIILIINLGYLIVLAAPVSLFFVLPQEGYLAVKALILFLAAVLCLFWTSLSFGITANIINYDKNSFKTVKQHFFETAPSAAVFGLILILYPLFFSFALPFYLSMESFAGFLVFFLILWLSVFFLLTSQFFFPIRNLLEKNTAKAIKKSFLIFIDNPGFSLALFLGSLLIIILSLFTALLFPGIGFVLVWLNSGLKLRLFKYDFKGIPGNERKRAIPWDELLTEEKEMLGKRSFKNLLFPWKE